MTAGFFMRAAFGRFGHGGLVIADIDIGHAAVAHCFAGVEAALAEVLRLDIADMEEAVAADAEIDEGGLDARLQIDDASFIDVADVRFLAGAFDIELFEESIFNDRDPAFLRLRDIDEHFAFHACVFFLVREGEAAALAVFCFAKHSHPCCA